MERGAPSKPGQTEGAGTLVKVASFWAEEDKQRFRKHFGIIDPLCPAKTGHCKDGGQTC